MPWCDGCDRFWTAEAVAPTDGACPRCGTSLPEPGAGRADSGQGAPWHFKLLVVAVVLYLGWRGAQGVVWVVGHL